MRALKVALIVFAILGILIIAGFGTFIIIINIPNDQTLARNVKVSYDWTEIDARSQFSAHNQVQHLCIRTPGIDWGSQDFNGVKLKDGTVLHPEIEIVDEQGKVQPLLLSGFVSKFYVDAEYSPVKGTGAFYKGRQFSKIRIRSDIPFDCDVIYWSDYDPE